jgi:putative nucleotidyltransferase with HDIG domain
MKKGDQDYILKLFPAIKKIKDPELSQKVILLWYKAWKRGNFPRIEQAHQFEPARDRLTYTNVDHTNQVCQLCEELGKVLPRVLNLPVNMDFLLAGAVLHDVDKMMIFDAKTGGFTETGRRFSHAAMGAAMALAEGLSEEVAHIIGAHSPRFSAIPPSSVEAIVLRHLDHVTAASVYLARGLDMDKVLAASLARIS